jgi:hypothetical protein
MQLCSTSMTAVSFLAEMADHWIEIQDKQKDLAG